MESRWTSIALRRSLPRQPKEQKKCARKVAHNPTPAPTSKDLHTDPEELTNLALNQRHSRRLSQMRAETLAELKRTDAGFASNLPPVKTTR